MDFNRFVNYVQKPRHRPGKRTEPECLALDSECQPTFYRATDEARPLWGVNHGRAAPLGSFQTGAQLEPHPPDSCSGPGLGLAAGASQSGAPGDSDSQATAHWRAFFFHPQPPGRPQRAGGPGPVNNCSVQWVPEHQVTGGLGQTVLCLLPVPQLSLCPTHITILP